jgi:transposase
MTIRNHLDYICNYYDLIEGINNRLKLIKRKAYGFLNFDNIHRYFLDCFSS